MAWYVYLAHFFSGVFLANAVPHFGHGISGKRFPTPFARPPGSGQSSPVVNVVWGMVNFSVGYALLFGVGGFTFGLNMDALMIWLGAMAVALQLAWHFGHLHKN